MIIEGAFYKIPEIILNSADIHYEAHLVNLLTNAILMELNTRNIANPMTKFGLEKQYPLAGNMRCDLYVNFDHINEELTAPYGFYSENWIEAKYFAGLDRAKGTETTSENAGSVMLDLYRLARYGTDAVHQKGLYAFIAFNRPPEQYLAFTRQNKSERTWLRSIFLPGRQSIQFNLQEEPGSIRDLFKTRELVMECSTRTLSIEPLGRQSEGFFGYLVQLLSCRIQNDHGTQSWAL